MIHKDIISDIKRVIEFEMLSLNDIKQFSQEVAHLVSKQFNRVHGETCTCNNDSDNTVNWKNKYGIKMVCRVNMLLKKVLYLNSLLK